jgi:hypothetical protein
MYPVAPASLIFFVKRISDILLLVIDSELFVVRGKLLRLMNTHNRAGGWLSSQTKSYPPSDDQRETQNCIGFPQLSDSDPNKIVRNRKTAVSLTRVPAWKAMFLANKRDMRSNAFSCDR